MSRQRNVLASGIGFGLALLGITVFQMSRAELNPIVVFESLFLVPIMIGGATISFLLPQLLPLSPRVPRVNALLAIALGVAAGFLQLAGSLLLKDFQVGRVNWPYWMASFGLPLILGVLYLLATTKPTPLADDHPTSN